MGEVTKETERLRVYRHSPFSGLIMAAAAGSMLGGAATISALARPEAAEEAKPEG